MNNKSFEEFLLDKGYMPFKVSMKTGKFEPVNPLRHSYSSLDDNIKLDYFHLSETDILNKIERGTPLYGFTQEERLKAIQYGLSEVHHPPVLLHPRPLIVVKRNDEDHFQDRDSSIDVVMEKIDHETIFKAMYNNYIVFVIDLRNK